MKDKLIEFKTAKLAREKGFKIPTRSFWDDHGSAGSKLVDFRLIKTEETDYNTKCKDIYLITASTQTTLQTWLRVKHGLVADVFQESKDKQYTGNWKGDISKLMIYQEEDLLDFPILDPDFKKCLEKVLYESLKMIP